MVQNARLDLRYGIRAGGVEPSFAEGANLTLSSQVSALSILFEPSRCPIRPGDVLVDVGCGRGRVIAYWLSQGITNRIIGIEINPGIARDTARRLRAHRNVSIVSGDVVEVLPEDGTLFFLFHPFDLRVMRRFRDALVARVRALPALRVVYYNPSEIAAFEEDARWQVRPMREVPGLIFDAAYICPAGGSGSGSRIRSAPAVLDGPGRT